MSCNNVVRRQEKRISGAGITPTIPASSDHRNGDWISTDIYEGEWCLNVTDGIWYTRQGNSIIQFTGLPTARFYKVEKSEDYVRPSQTTEGLINQTTTLENYLTLDFTSANAGNYRCFGWYTFSTNDASEDFIDRVRIVEGASTIKELVQLQTEVKDVGGTGVLLNTLSGGVIGADVNTGTDQRMRVCFSFNVTLLAATNYSLQLDWAGSIASLGAAIYEGEVCVEEKPITP